MNELDVEFYSDESGPRAQRCLEIVDENPSYSDYNF